MQEVEAALDHLTGELLRLQQQQTPWLMTPQEEYDLLHTIEQAVAAMRHDQEVRQELQDKEDHEAADVDCPPSSPAGYTWMRTDTQPWDYTCEVCGKHWDRYPRSA